MPTTLVTAPTEEPITLAEANKHLRMDMAEDNTLIESLITVARLYTETLQNRALITQTWDLFLDDLETEIELPYAPLQSVTSVKYYDTAGDQQTLADTVYTVDTDSEPGRIYTAYGENWPTYRAIPNTIVIRFVAGYGDAADVPQSTKQGMLLLIGHLYENREATSEVNLMETPIGIKHLLWMNKLAIRAE